MAADGSVIIETKIDDGNVEVTFKDIQNSAKRMSETVSSAGEKARISVQKQIDSFSKLNNQYALQEKKVNALKEKIAEYSKQKIPTEEYREIQNQISKASDKLGELTKRQERFLETGGKTNSKAYKNMQYDMEDLTKTIEYAKAELKDLESTENAFTLAIHTDQAQRDIAALEREEAKLLDMGNRLQTSFDSVRQKMNECTAEITKSASESTEYVGALKSTFIGLKSAAHAPVALVQKLGTSLKERGPQIAAAGIKKLNSTLKRLAQLLNTLLKNCIKLASGAISGGLKKISNGIFGIAKSANKSTTSLGNMTKALKTIVKYTIGLRSLFILANKIRSAATEGFQNLAQYSSSTNASISMLMSSVARLKNSLATAFNPILQVAAPALTKLIDLCSKATTSVGMFFAALTGKSVFTRAKSVNQDYAKSLNSTASSTDKVTSAANKQAQALKNAQKAAKGSIAAFDELNIIQFDTVDAMDDLSDTADKSDGLLPSDMFEDVPIDSKIRDFANKLKRYIQSEDWKGLGEYIAKQLNKGLQKVYDAINWKKVGPKVTKFCKAFTESFNSMVDNLDWDLLGRVIGAGINDLVRTFNLLFGPDGIDFENLGKKFSVGLRGMLDEVSWTELGNALGNKFMILWRTLEGFVDEMSTKNQEGLTGWQQLGDAIADTLNGTFDRISFKDMAHTVATGINGVFAALQEAVDEFDWDKFTQNIKDGITTFLKETDWKANGEALGNFIEHLCQAIQDTMTEDNFEKIGEAIADFLQGLPWKTMLYTAALTIRNAFAGLLKGMATTPAGRFAEAFAIALMGASVIAKVIKAFRDLFGTAATSGAGGAIQMLKGAGVFAKFASAIGIGAAAGLTVTEKTTSTEADLKSTEQLLSNFSVVLEDLKEKGTVSGDAMQQLYEKVDAISADTSPTGTISALRDALVEAGVSSDQLATSIGNTDASLDELYNVMANSTGSIDSATGKTKTFAQAIQDTETSSLIEKLNSLQYASDKVNFADLILKSANAIDEMGGIWENGKQILGEKAIAIHEEIVDKGLNPDKDGFYKLANGQMVQYGQGIEDSTGTLKEKTKSTLDAGLMTGIQEALPEQQQIGWDLGGYFITGYTEALNGNKRLQSIYKEALEGIDTTSAKEKAKSDGEDLAKNTGSGFKKGLEGVSSEVTDSVTKMMDDDVKEPVKKSLDIHSPSGWFAQMATYCGQGFGDKLEAAFASTFSFFKNFRTRLSNDIGSLYTIGYNVMIGMNNGMVAGASAMYNNAKIIASNVANTFRNAWKIHSPSRVAGDIGGYFMEGMYNQMDAWGDKILSLLSKFGDSVTGKMNLKMPEIQLPVSLSLPKTNLQSYMPVMASGTVIPPKTSSSGKTNTQELESMIQKVLLSMPRSNNNNDGNMVQQFREAMSGMAVTLDGRLVGYLQEKNQQDLDRGGYGLFPSAAY